MNKKGAGYIVMLFAFMAVIIIFLGGIVWGVQAFYGKGYEYRPVEAKLLGDIVLDCFQNNDFFANGFSENFYEVCGLNSDVILGNSFILISDGTRRFSVGVNAYETQCALIGGLTNKDYPRCVSGTVVKDGVEYAYIFASNHQSRRLRV